MGLYAELGEVIDRDAAKDSRSKVIVEITTTSGAKIPVECVVSGAFSQGAREGNQEDLDYALLEGRLIVHVNMDDDCARDDDFAEAAAALELSRRLSIDSARPELDVEQIRVLGRDVLCSTMRRVVALQTGESDRRNRRCPRQNRRRSVTQEKPVSYDFVFVTRTCRSLRHRMHSVAVRQTTLQQCDAIRRAEISGVLSGRRSCSLWRDHRSFTNER